MQLLIPHLSWEWSSQPGGQDSLYGEKMISEKSATIQRKKNTNWLKSLSEEFAYSKNSWELLPYNSNTEVKA